MKKATKIILLAMVVVLLFASCGEKKEEPKLKEFSKAGLTISLPEEFGEKEVVTQTATYVSLDSVVMILKEEFSMFEKMGMDPKELTLDEYFELIKTNNGSDWELKEDEGLKYFDYSTQVNGKDMSYMGTILKGTDAFWLVQFSCESGNFADKKADFLKWAKSIKVE